MKKNVYVGKWEEKGWCEINLTFTPESLKYLLDQALNESEPEFTHQDIANWCGKYWWKTEEEELDSGADKVKQIAVKVAKDIDCQWELFLVNTYSLADLQNLDFSKVKLPIEWFEKWLHELHEGN
jgi:hypothetical protein